MLFVNLIFYYHLLPTELGNFVSSQSVITEGLTAINNTQSRLIALADVSDYVQKVYILAK